MASARAIFHWFCVQSPLLLSIMCGRYALGIRAAFVRHRLRQDNMQVDEFAEDDETRETYNFAPGYNGLVYRANVPDTGARTQEQDSGEQGSQQDNAGSNVEDAKSIEETKQKGDAVATQHSDEDNTKFRLQAMRWGTAAPNWLNSNSLIDFARTDSVLDQAQSRLRQHAQNNQLPR